MVPSLLLYPLRLFTVGVKLIEDRRQLRVDYFRSLTWRGINNEARLLPRLVTVSAEVTLRMSPPAHQTHPSVLGHELHGLRYAPKVACRQADSFPE